MKKVINGSSIEFWNEEKNEKVMYIDYSTDECAWYFHDSSEITITKDMELFGLLENIMRQQYRFNNDELLLNYKDNNKLVWYSDCYYNPDDEWSINNVSCLTINYLNGTFILKCIKPLNDIFGKIDCPNIIVFSPLGNGKYAKNINSGLTLQDDIVMMVYQELLKKEKSKKLSM